MEPKVAVIVPVYNMERYLRECLDSLVGQTFKDIEIICFNDASTDSSIDILREYAARDERFVIIDSPVNIKQGGGRNAGIRAARAPYIMFVDPDDWVEPDFVEKYYNKAIETGADIVTGDYSTFCCGKRTQMSVFGKKLPNDTDNIKRKHLYANTYIVVNLFHRDLFVNNNLFFPENIQLGEDVAISSGLFLAAKKIVKIDAHLYNYRIVENSSSRQPDWSRFKYRYICALMARDNAKRIDVDNKFVDEITYFFINSYFRVPIIHAIFSYGKVLTDEIRYANRTITDHVSEAELQTFLSRLSKGECLSLSVLHHSPVAGIILYKSIRLRSKVLNAIKTRLNPSCKVFS